MMKKLLIGFLALFCFPAWAADISTPGTYGPGVYTLVNNISVSSGDALVFTGAATVNLNGFTVSTTQTGNVWDHGIKMQAGGSVSNGTVSGFRVGVKFDGAGSSTGVNVSARYIGHWIQADDVTISGGDVSDIGGVTDEKYAIGVLCNAANCGISGVAFRNIFVQANATPSLQGEGLAVNFSSQSSNGSLLNSSYENDHYEGGNIGVFAAGAGGHLIDGFSMVNIYEPLQIAPTTPVTTARNVTVAYTVNDSNPGTILSETLDGNFGNVYGKTIRIRLAASALSQASGTQTRITLHASGDEPFQIGAAYIGHASSGANASSLTQLKFSGANGVTIPTGGNVTTDWASFQWDGSSDILITIYVSGDASNDKMPAKTGTPHDTYYKNGSETAQTSVSGYYLVTGYLSAVGTIEAQ